MTAPKLTQDDIKQIQKLLEKGHKPKNLAKKYGVHVSVIYRRAKYPYQAKYVPIDIKNKVIQKIKEGLSKASSILHDSILDSVDLWQSSPHKSL